MEESSPYRSAPRCDLEGLMTGRVAVKARRARKYLFLAAARRGLLVRAGSRYHPRTDYILLHTLLGTGSQERFDKAARHILSHQNEDGADLCPRTFQLSALGEGLLWLKLAGFTADGPRWRAPARKFCQGRRPRLIPSPRSSLFLRNTITTRSRRFRRDRAVS
jgi:hypothetical protein